MKIHWTIVIVCPVDLMVKKNLVYVDPQDLGSMDFLTTDLDTPEGHLKVEVCYLLAAEDGN